MKYGRLFVFIVRLIVADVHAILVQQIKRRLVGPTERWRPWFAWHPVSLGYETVWLRWIERRVCGMQCGTHIEYRLARMAHI